MSALLNLDDLSVDQVCSLYDPSKVGVLAFPDIISPDTCARINEEVSRHADLFTKVPEKVYILGGATVRQEMDTLYFEDLPSVPSSLDTILRPIVEEFDEFYQRVALVDGSFYSLVTQSIGLHNYWAGSVGITPHQDFPEDRNLIASFVLEGSSGFGAAMNREREGEVLFDAPAGSLILMRAPREGDGKKFRAWHYVLPTVGERKSLLLRKKDVLVKSRASMVRYS